MARIRPLAPASCALCTVRVRGRHELCGPYAHRLWLVIEVRHDQLATPFTCADPVVARLAGLITRSSFFRSAPGPFIGVFDFVTNNVLGVAESVQGAGDCLAFMAVDPSLDGRSGLYFNNETTGIPGISPGHKFTEKLPSVEAQSSQEAQRLWELSAKLTEL